MGQNILISRVGWMKKYEGIEGDSIKGAGTFNDTEIGHEVYNFKNVQGKVFGFAQCLGKDEELAKYDKINTARIGRYPEYDKVQGHISDCLVIFISKNPVTKLKTIVGWYEDAIVMGISQESTKDMDRSDKQYNIIANPEKSYLIDEHSRNFELKHGKDVPGQSNVFYFYDESTNFMTERGEFYDEVLNYIDETKLTLNPLINSHLSNHSQKEIEGVVNEVIAKNSFGFSMDSVFRKKIELHAMLAAQKYFEAQAGTELIDMSAQESFDFLLKQKDGTVRYVEVKGTTRSLETVILTKNEYELALKEQKTILFVVYNISFDGENASGGELFINEKFIPEAECSTPISYLYDLKKHLLKL